MISRHLISYKSLQNGAAAFSLLNIEEATSKTATANLYGANSKSKTSP